MRYIQFLIILTLLISPATFAITYKKYSCDYTKDIEACDGTCIHSGVETNININNVDRINVLTIYKGRVLASSILECDIESSYSFTCYDDPKQKGYEKSRSYNTYKLKNKVLQIKRFDKKSNVLLGVFCGK